MPTKLDILKLTKLMKKRKKICGLTDFIKQVVSKEMLEHFYMSFELTLFTYNVIINGYRRLNTIEMRAQILYTLRYVHDKKEDFTPQEIDKIERDIRYIEENKLFTYISDTYMYLYSAYFFFANLSS